MWSGGGHLSCISEILEWIGNSLDKAKTIKRTLSHGPVKILNNDEVQSKLEFYGYVQGICNVYHAAMHMLSTNALHLCPRYA